MSKTVLLCACGGKHADNPSAKARHVASRKHRATLVAKFAEIQPGPDAPPAPVLIPGGHPISDAESAAVKRAYAVSTAIRELTPKLDKAKRDLAYRTSPKHAHQYGERAVANTERVVADLEEQLALWQTELAGLDDEIRALKSARSEADLAMYDAVALYLATIFSGDSRLWVQHRGGAEFEVHWLTGKVLEDREGNEYPETDFGYSARVYGPRMGWDRDWNGKTKPTPAYPSWGSYSGMDTVAAAERMLAVYALSIEVAKELNRLAGLEG